MVSFRLLAVLAALAPAVFAHPAADIAERQTGRYSCGAEPSSEFLAEAASFSNLEKTYDNSSARFNIAQPSSLRATIVIQTYFHVVARSTALSGGYIPQSQLTAQLNVMNSNYGTYSILLRIQYLTFNSSLWNFIQASRH